MRISKFFAVIFGLLGAAIAAGTVFLCLQSLNQEPVLVKAPISATTQVESMMRAVCKNDYAAVSELIYGNPDLGASLESEDPVTATIWDAFIPCEALTEEERRIIKDIDDDAMSWDMKILLRDEINENYRNMKHLPEHQLLPMQEVEDAFLKKFDQLRRDLIL